MDTQVAIDIHRHFASPRERVYRAFTDETELASWFGPFAGWVVPGTVSIEARVGGHRRLSMETYSGTMRWTIDTTYTDVVENVRLVGYEKVTGYPAFEGIDPFKVSLEFFDEGGGTRLELRVNPCPREAETTSRDFWMQSFSKLDSLLAHDDGPTSRHN
ncbi:SRPBCC family protein [Aeromicrobium sp.]|uniref:SRPBCC family protein n=1 Tax=Aeromicrobium sp. TaxID=1871063 RepID=UPI002FCB2FA4